MQMFRLTRDLHVCNLHPSSSNRKNITTSRAFLDLRVSLSMPVLYRVFCSSRGVSITFVLCPVGGKPTGVLCGEPSAPLRRCVQQPANQTGDAQDEPSSSVVVRPQCVHIYTYVCTCTRAYTYAHVYVHAYTHVCAHACTQSLYCTHTPQHHGVIICSSNVTFHLSLQNGDDRKNGK